MAKVVKPPVEVFPPSDRELALRAQIRTGWSTISNRDAHCSGLTSSEMKQIQQVLEKAQAMERMEEIRIGLQMLKHKEMVEKCHGDGVSTCRICNRDFSHKSHNPVSVYYCADCQLVVCNRCKIPADKVILCTICYEERELWKRSGFWLNNNFSIPTITIPLEDLEEIRQQNAAKNRRLAMGNKENVHDFVSPYQLEVEDEEDDDDDVSLTGSQKLEFSPETGHRTSSPSLLDKLEQFRTKSLEMDSSTVSDSDDMKTHSRSRSGSGLGRRTAITKSNRERLLSSRDRARSRSSSGSKVPGPHRSHSGGGSSTLPDHGHMAKSDSKDLYEEILGGSSHPNTGSIPGIKLRKPSTQTTPSHGGSESLNFVPGVVPVVSSSPEDSEPECANPPVIHQMTKTASTDSDVIMVDVEKSISPLMFSRQYSPGVSIKQDSPAHSRPWGGQQEKEAESVQQKPPPPQKPPTMSPQHTQKSPSSQKPISPQHSQKPMPVPRPRKTSSEELPAKAKPQDPFGDEFRKVQSPSKGELKKVGASPTRVPDTTHVVEEEKPATSDDLSDLFRKVGSPPRKPPAVLTGEAKQESPVKARDTDTEFKKVGVGMTGLPPSGDDRDEFRRVRSGSGSGRRAEQEEEVKVKTVLPLTSAPLSPPPTHSPPSKPVVPTRKRVLPSALPQQEQEQRQEENPTPFLGTATITDSLHHNKTISDIGKQGSNVSVASSVMSEASTTIEIDYGTVSSPTSITSSSSGDSQSKFPPTPAPRPPAPSLDEVAPSPPKLAPSPSPVLPDQTSPSRGMTRRNATRVSRNKRPPPLPRSAEEQEVEGSADTGKESEGTDEGSQRFRTRSNVVTRPVVGARRHRGMRGGARDEAAGSGGESQPLAEVSEEQEEMGRGRLRGSSLNKQDLKLARKARTATSKEAGQGAGRAPNYRADGQFGSIQMTLAYRESSSELEVTVHSCKGLRGMDKSGLSDPYVKLFLQPRHKLEKFRTKTIFKNLNPHFQESFTFTGVSMQSMENRKLCAVVMDYDELTKDDLIGGTHVNLYEVLHSTTHEICVKRLLDDRSVPKETVVRDRGSLHLYIQYSVETKALVISVVSAKNLPTRGQYEVFVKCTWNSRGQCVKGKTRNSKKTTDPEFNEDLVLKANLRDLTYSKLQVSVWEHHSLKDKLLGELHFNTVTFWKAFVSDPTRVVQDWYPLEAPAGSNGGSTGTLPRHLQ